MEPLNPHYSLSKLLLTFSLLFSLSLSNPDSTALLSFKSSSSSNSLLSTWTSNNTSPCSWFGVTCNPSTHRVTKLVLDNLNLSGSIHPLTRLTHLRHLSLHHNRLSSAPPSFASWPPNLKHIYLSHNLLAGKFPHGVLGLRRLRRLDLSYNKFSGEIPMTDLTQLTHLLTLKLDYNSFTGNLDSGNFSSNSITQFNVSGNKLYGEIPNWLSNFPLTSFSDNAGLCGNPLPKNCLSRPISTNATVGSDSVTMGRGPTNHGKNRRLSDKVLLIIIIGDAIAVMATLVIVTCYCYKKKYDYKVEEKSGGKGNIMMNCASGGGGGGGGGRDEMMVCFEGCKGFAKVDELLRASAEMLGKGSVGTTYKVLMEGGDLVVVKRVRERRKRKEISGFLRDIGGLRHTNVVGLRAYYSSLDELLLVYDFLPNGSLHSLLHG